MIVAGRTRGKLKLEFGGLTNSTTTSIEIHLAQFFSNNVVLSLLYTNVCSYKHFIYANPFSNMIFCVVIIAKAVRMKSTYPLLWGQPRKFYRNHFIEGLFTGRKQSRMDGSAHMQRLLYIYDRYLRAHKILLTRVEWARMCNCRRDEGYFHISKRFFYRPSLKSRELISSAKF